MAIVGVSKGPILTGCQSRSEDVTAVSDGIRQHSVCERRRRTPRKSAKKESGYEFCRETQTFLTNEMPSYLQVALERPSLSTLTSLLRE